MDVGGWLRGLGLDQYEANFRDDEIDADVLPQLTADDLKEIGVSAVGDRRRLLAAITALSGRIPSADAPASPPEPAPAKGLQLSAERRPITVMFCDLVGSTSLALRLDAEDWRNLVSAYLDAAEAAVTAFGGRVLKKLGDGLMALFGYPQAQENDAERAVRAALAIHRALADLNARNARSARPSFPPASASNPDRSSSTLRAKCSARHRISPRACKRRPNPAQSSSPPPYSARSPGCSSPRTKASMSSRACLSRSRSIASCARAAAAGAAAGGRSPRSSEARRSSTSSCGVGNARAPARASSCRSSASPASAARFALTR